MKIESLQKFRNMHGGKRIWICGSGGSLLNVIPDKIPKDDIVICCNSSTLHFEKFDYAIFTDETANWSNWGLNIGAKGCSQINCNMSIVAISSNTTYLEKEWDKWKFGESDEKVIGGYDVIHCATHIAWIMGASEIILAGVDLKHMSRKSKYAYPQELIDGASIDFADIIMKSNEGNDDLFDGHLGMSLTGWELIHKHNSLNVKTISTDTNLKLYPFESFESLCK